MNGSRLRYILGGAVLGALLGAMYANYLYVKTDPTIFVPNGTVRDYEPTETVSETVTTSTEDK